VRIKFQWPVVRVVPPPPTEPNPYRLLHFRECGCHDSWDQCPCAGGGHHDDCDCCGLGICGPLARADAIDPQEASDE